MQHLSIKVQTLGSKLALVAASMLLGGAGLTGCGAGEGMESAEAAEAADEVALEESGELVEGLGQAACGSNPTKTFAKMFTPTYTSGSNYGSAACARALLTRTTNYHADDSSHYNYIQYAGPMPTTAAACTKTTLKVDTYEVTTAGSRRIKQSVIHGVAGTDLSGGLDCQLPSLALDPINRCLPTPALGLVKGNTYQFAIAALAEDTSTAKLHPVKMGMANTFCVR